jgi:hypothetical protein
VLAIALLGIALTGCGHTGKTVGSTVRGSASYANPRRAPATADGPNAASTQGYLKTDSDDDNDNPNPATAHYDADDNVVLYYGHAANAADTRAIASIIKSYYVAAAAGDGPRACLLIYSLLVETAAEDLSQTAREDETCAAAMSKFFKRDHSQFKADTAKIEVTVARVDGDSGLALVRLGARERRVLVHRDHGTWKVNTLLDIGVP